MARFVVYRDDFTAGVLSRAMLARVGSPPYAAGCRAAVNMIPTRTGSMLNVPGTYRVANALAESHREEIFYDKSASAYWIFSFTTASIEIYLGSTKALVTTLTMPGTWTAAELFEFQQVVVNNEMWIAHGNHALFRVSYNGSAFSLPATTLQTGLEGGSAETDLNAGAGTYPSVIFYAQRRLFLAATGNQPSTIWGSRAPTVGGVLRLDDFRYGSTMLPSDRVKLVESDMLGAKVCWLAGTSRVIVGTTRGIHAATADYISAVDSSSLGVKAFDLMPALTTACAPVQAVNLGNAVVFVGRSGKTIHAAEYANDGGLQEAELTRYQRELLEPGVRCLAAMQYPYPAAWAAMGDGSVVAVQIDVAASLVAVTGHQRSPEGATARKTLWVTSARGSVEDRLYFSVARVGQGGSIELQAPFDPSNDEMGDSEGHYVDGGFYLHSAGGATTYADARLVPGVSYEIWADGSPRPAQTAQAGSPNFITFDRTVHDAHIGLKRTMYFQPTIPDLPVQGSGQAQVRQIEGLHLRLVDSLGGAAGPDLASVEPLVYLTPGDYVLGAAIEPYSGDANVPFYGYNTDALSVVVSQPIPARIEVAAVVILVGITEVV